MKEVESGRVLIHLQVDGMMCQRNCGTSVQKPLRQMTVEDPVTLQSDDNAVASVRVVDATASFSEQRAQVTLELTPVTSSWQLTPSSEQYLRQQAVAAVEEIGFDATCLAIELPEPRRRLAIYLAVEGMMCQRNCGTTVERALRAMTPRVTRAEASFAERQAYVTLDLADGESQEHWIQAAIDAVEDVGFEASLSRVAFESKGAETWTPSADQDSCEPIQETVSLAEMNSEHDDTALVFQVGGMSCAVCTRRVEQVLQNTADSWWSSRSDSSVPVSETPFQATVVLATGRAFLEYQGDDWTEDARQELAQACVVAVQHAGYECQVSLSRGSGLLDSDAQGLDELQAWRRLLVYATVGTVPLLYLSNTIHCGPDTGVTAWDWVEFLLCTVLQFGIGYRYYRAAYKGWTLGRVIGMDFLVVLGTTASYVYSVTVLLIRVTVSQPSAGHGKQQLDLRSTFSTGPLLLLFVTMGKFLESFARRQTASSLRELLALQPQQAWRVTSEIPRNSATADDKGCFAGLDLSSLSVEEVCASDIQVGDFLLVYPG
jgi:cation transport ATPase